MPLVSGSECDQGLRDVSRPGGRHVWTTFGVARGENHGYPLLK